jgi:crossover junction endodeoxyribonuclease RuvC
MGYAFIESKNGRVTLLESGCITTPTNTPDPQRLLEIKNDLEKLINKRKPAIFCIESLYFAANSKTAMSVGQARGVALLAAAEHGMQIIEMTPLQVKIAVTGYGKAEKSQVQRMLMTLLKIKKVPKPDDAADAAAIAWAGIGRVRMLK